MALQTLPPFLVRRASLKCLKPQKPRPLLTWGLGLFFQSFFIQFSKLIRVFYSFFMNLCLISYILLFLGCLKSFINLLGFFMCFSCFCVADFTSVIWLLLVRVFIGWCCSLCLMLHLVKQCSRFSLIHKQIGKLIWIDVVLIIKRGNTLMSSHCYFLFILHVSLCHVMTFNVCMS